MALDFERDGAAIVVANVSSENIAELREEFSKLDFRAGARPFALSSLVSYLISNKGCFGAAARELGLGAARAVRVLAFDKTPESNWNLGWHQDRVIALKERREVSGFGTWTLKGGVPHVEAPFDILKNMFSLRLHLDHCGAENGALKILPGSASLGKLVDSEVRELSKRVTPFTCELALGEILAMKALTIHASEPSQKPSHRRVLHVDYCICELPHSLEWALEL
jgi:Phytanoyl-CoA dioxygenase (PhyH)